MAKGKWESVWGKGVGDEHLFMVNGYMEGRISQHITRDNRPSGVYYGSVFPPGIKPKRSVTVAAKVPEAEAKAAVEEYWADKEPIR